MAPISPTPGTRRSIRSAPPTSTSWRLPGGSRPRTCARDPRLISTFGKSGVVDLKLDDDQVMDLVNGEAGLHAAPIVAGNTVIIGAAHLSGGVPRSRTNEKGYIRGFDVKTGKRLWIFHTIPDAG